MKLRTIVAFAVCLVMAQFMFSQEKKDPKEVVKRAFVSYDTLIANKNFEGAAEAILPAFFEQMPKEQYLAMMKEVYENEDMKITLHPADSVIVEAIQEIGETYYATLTYATVKDIEYHTKKGDSEQKSRTKLSTVKLFFRDTYGADNVTFNEETSEFEIKTTKEAYAVSTDAIHWKFLAVDLEGMERIYGQLLPTEIYTVPEPEEPATEE